MNTKRYIAIVVVLVMNLAMSGCGAGQAPEAFSGTWEGIDPYDGSVVTIMLFQKGQELDGSYNDSFTRNVKPPGYFGKGSGTILSSTTAQIIFYLSRWDGETLEYEVELTFSNQDNTITMLDCFGYTTIIKKKERFHRNVAQQSVQPTVMRPESWTHKRCFLNNSGDSLLGAPVRFELGGRKNNQTAVIVEAVSALWLVRHPEDR